MQEDFTHNNLQITIKSSSRTASVRPMYFILSLFACLVVHAKSWCSLVLRCGLREFCLLVCKRHRRTCQVLHSIDRGSEDSINALKCHSFKLHHALIHTVAVMSSDVYGIFTLTKYDRRFECRSGKWYSLENERPVILVTLISYTCLQFNISVMGC